MVFKRFKMLLNDLKKYYFILILMEKQNNDVINNPNVVYLNYYQRNKEKILERRKEYVKNNYEKVLEQNRKYYNKEYFRNYYHKKKPVEVHSTQST
jgi:hypothetical protein